MEKIVNATCQGNNAAIRLDKINLEIEIYLISLN